jgi:hypothetical protein
MFSSKIYLFKLDLIQVVDPIVQNDSPDPEQTNIALGCLDITEVLNIKFIPFRDLRRPHIQIFFQEIRARIIALDYPRDIP